MAIPNSIGGLSAIFSSAALLCVLACGSAAAQTDAGAGKTSGTAQNPAGAPAGGAQKPTDDSSDKLKDLKITLNADQDNLLDTLRTFMKSAKLDFVIDNELKNGTVTVHFKDVLFKDALATIVKVSTIPITYELKDGVYHFKLRVDPPAEEKPTAPAVEARPQAQVGRVPLGQISRADALRKLTGPYDVSPPTQYYHSTQPISHGATSSFGLSGNGLLQSNAFKFNPDGSVSRTGGSPINVFNLLRGLIGGLH